MMNTTKNYLFSLLFYSSYGTGILMASDLLDVNEAADYATLNDITRPKADIDGRVPTLNKKGAMSPQLDLISQKFIKLSSNPNTRVLEIGSSYGLACMESLNAGCQEYWANDMDKNHLFILARSIKENQPRHLKNLKLIPGTFPNEISPKSNYFDAILCARVLHFMNPEAAAESISMAHKFLKPGGKIFAVMLSPYVKGYRSFIPEFTLRVSKGVHFPGYVDDLSVFADPELIPPNDQQKYGLKQPFMFFNIESAKSAFQDAGFYIDEVVEMPLPYHSPIWQLDGRENIGLIATKIY